MARRKYRQEHLLDDIDSILSLQPPAEEDIEKLMLFLILNGHYVQDIFEGLDERCFYIPDHKVMFAAAKELYDSLGFVPYDSFCKKVGCTPEKVKEYLGELCSDVPHLDYYIRILQLLKIRRAVVFESVTMIYNAMNDRYDGDDLLDDCDAFGRRVRERGVTRIKDPNMEDWFVRDDEKYFVKKGKNGLPDYCLKNGKFISEPKMLSQGFRRESLPKQQASESDLQL